MTEATTGEDRLSELLVPFRSGRSRAAILCDLDGTLAPIVPDPERARVPEPIRELLGRLASAYALVGCVTGRPALRARELTGLAELHYAGNHGLELLAPGEQVPRLAHELEGRAEEARRFVAALDPLALDAAGIAVEDKGPIQALHWRRAEDEGLARARAEEVASAAERAGLEPRFGRKVLELRPRVDVDKGTAVRALLAGTPVGLALFAGDDATDLDAFRALRELVAEGALEAGLCIGIASSEAPPELAEASDAIVAGPAGFRGVLAKLAG